MKKQTKIFILFGLSLLLLASSGSARGSLIHENGTFPASWMEKELADQIFVAQPSPFSKPVLSDRKLFCPFILKNAAWSPAVFCLDRDGGLNYEIAGYVLSSDQQGNSRKYDDTCGAGNDEGFLKEQYCDKTQPLSSKHFCTYGCAEGRCLSQVEVCTDVDGDDFSPVGGECGPVDCNDTNQQVHPGASEICSNGIDDDCNTLIDLADPSCKDFCTDVDGDGYSPLGGECGPVDCSDINPKVHPGASEICSDGIDDDCDNLIDLADPSCIGLASCLDSDGGQDFGVTGQVEGSNDLGNPYFREDTCGLDEFEGYLNEQYCKADKPWIAQQFCEYGCKNGACSSWEDICTDEDGDTYASTGGQCGLLDCDDADPGKNPGNTEICDNEVDDDCDAQIDAADLDCSGVTSCTDSDGGLNFTIFGNVTGTGEQGSSYEYFDVCDTGDYAGRLNEKYCSGTIYSAFPHTCDFGCSDGACSLWSEVCTDADGDGYATNGDQCGAVDCQDNNPDLHPGAPEACSNNIDDNCDGYVDIRDLDCLVCTDQDGDGYGIEGGLCGPVDCNDLNPDIYPNALEDCDNGIDDNCNGKKDLAEPRCNLTTPLNTIVIGWDGTQRDHFWECYNKQLPECANGLPNIKALTGGVIFNNTTTNGETSTKPGWTQLFTGYDAEVTGVFSLIDYQPIPEGYSVFEKLENQFGPDNIVSIFVSAKSVHTGGACIGDPTYKNGEPVIEDLGQPWCLAKDHLDYFELDKIENDLIGNRALELVEAHQDDLFFSLFIFTEPDRMGHLMGENSVEYTQQLIKVDEWLGKIVSKLIDLGIYDQTLVYIATDHGFGEGKIDHLNAPYGIFAGNDPLLFRSGDRKDPAATFLERYGISRGAIGGAPALDGYSLYSFPPLACIPEGEAYIDYENAPSCCAGLELVGMDLSYGASCIADTGGINENSGYCTKCGNGSCELPENRCNCPQDCD